MKAVEDHRLALNDAYRLEFKTYKDELALFEADRKGVMQDRQAKARKGERGADIAALGPEPEPPLLPTVIASDPTVEGLTKHLGQGRPSLGLFSDEGGSFLGGSAMSEDNRLKTVATLSGYWDGSPINRTRAGDGQSTHFGKRLACHLMVQPVAAANLLSDPVANGQGFLARFLIVHPQSTMGTRFYRNPKPESQPALDVFADRIGQLLRQEPRMREGTRNELDPQVITLSPDARALLAGFADTVEAELPEGREFETIRPFAAKAAEHACRIAGVMAAYTGKMEVSEGIMRCATELAKHYGSEAVRLTNAAAISAEAEKLERMRKWLTSKWSEEFVSPPDAARLGPFRETKVVKKMLSELADLGWLVPAEEAATILGRNRREAFRVVRA